MRLEIADRHVHQTGRAPDNALRAVRRTKAREASTAAARTTERASLRADHRASPAKDYSGAQGGVHRTRCSATGGGDESASHLFWQYVAPALRELSKLAAKRRSLNSRGVAAAEQRCRS